MTFKKQTEALSERIQMLFSKLGLTLQTVETQEERETLICTSAYLSLSISILIDSLLNNTSIQSLGEGSGSSTPSKSFVEKNV